MYECGRGADKGVRINEVLGTSRIAFDVRKSNGKGDENFEAAGVLAIVVARMAGNVIGAYHDGDTLEWFACTLFAILVFTVTVAFAARR